MKSVEEKFNEWFDNHVFSLEPTKNKAEKAFIAGHNQGRQDLMSESVEGFEEWIAGNFKLPETDRQKETFGHMIECWQAAKLSSAKEIEKLEKQVGELKKHSGALYQALNSAHGYIDPRENKRTDKLCKEALCDFETYQEIKG